MTTILFDHIAIAVSRLADTPAVLVGELGASPFGGGTSPGFSFGQWRFGGGGRIEILEPRGVDGFLHRFLARHGAGIHHVTFQVPSLCEACDRAESAGYTIVGYDDSDPGWKEAFLHPKEALGVVVQLAEAGPSNEEELLRWQAPPGPPDPPPPVTLLGLRLRAQSRERADQQWLDVLKGEASGGERGDLIYRWPGSPMRIAVAIDPVMEEGPLAIEIASDRPIPEGRHPLLGVELRRAG